MPSTDNEPATDRTEPATDRTEPNWATEYDVEPIRIRDPIAEALTVLAPGEPFVITYEDVVKAAGHSCPTAAGAFRLAQVGLDALYPDGVPVRSEIEVRLPAPRDDPTYGVLGRLLSFVTGAAAEDGFGGLAGGHGGRRDLLRYDAFEAERAAPTVRFRRRDTGHVVEVTYHVGDVPDAGPAVGALEQLVDGTATDGQRAAFAEAWHGRVRIVLDDESLFSVERIEDRA